MATKFLYNESANTGPNAVYLLSPRFLGIAFSLIDDYYTISSVNLKLANYGSPVGTLSVNIYLLAFVGGVWEPTGASLASGTLNQALITDYSGSWTPPYAGVGDLHEITLDAQPVLDRDETYGILCQASGGTLGVDFTAVMASTAYSYGPNVTSTNIVYTGAEWQDYSVVYIIGDAYGTRQVYLPEKAITPNPTDANTGVTLDQNDMTWVDGGLGAINEATTFDVYYGDTSGDLTEVSSAQDAGVATNAFIIWELLYGSPFDYAVTRYWRVDSTNEWGTTTGDEWSFTTLTFDPPVPNPPVPPDPPSPPEPVFNPNFIRTTQRITCACGNQFWYEIS